MDELGLLMAPEQTANGSDGVRGQRRVNDVEEEMTPSLLALRLLAEFCNVVRQE
jgi:hypothetical protein